MIEGYERTGVPLGSYQDTCNLEGDAVIGPAGFTEDLGSYYFIPKIVEFFGVNLDTASLLL